MSGKSSGGGQQTTTTVPWEGQQPYLKDLFSEAQNFFQGSRPDLGASQALGKEGIASLTGAAETVQPYITGAQGAGQRLISGEFLSPDANPAFQQYLQTSNDAITKQFTEGLLPGLTSGAAASGNIGSSRQGVAEGLAAGKTLDALQRNTAQLTSSAYGQGLDAYIKGLSLAPQTAGLSSLPASYYGAASDAQYNIDAGKSEQDLTYLNAYKNLVGGAGYGGTTTTTGPGTKSGGVAGALGGAAVGSYFGVPGAVIGGVAGYFT